ncbi:right-handed parallel beta-helix repeat-containing protein [Paraflavitalea soli]|nr:right-handed parallel beta-helix repeat-containing protein [Paraflavitalea soli]
MNRKLSIISFLLLVVLIPLCSLAQPFVHPGVDQSAKDLAYMKGQVLKGAQPWKGAFDRLKAATDTAFTAVPFAHVLRGPYGKPNIGGNDLSKSAAMAYNYAIVWYITGDKTYANRAIGILDAWTPVLWHFDYNDAKLLAAWTGHALCNAAEILRYTNAGWKQESVGRFKSMLMDVYYPLLRFYYPQANGNWDGAIIHSIMAMGIFLDNRAMFDNAVDHFLHAPVNGSLFKYIYPSGQCQESTRDQGHVQLGLGEFAGAAQIAFTQGVDLFSIGGYRLAMGYEYTARFLLGEKPHCYGVISERAKELRDDYEYVYQHHKAINISLPYTERAADSVRSKASRSVLTAVRAPNGVTPTKGKTPIPDKTGYIAGATKAPVIPADAVLVAPGQSIQQALDEAAGSGRWVVAKAGIHTLPATLKIPSGVVLAGEGIATVLFLDPASGARETMVNGSDDLHDVTIRDLVIEGAASTTVPSDPNSGRSYRGGYNRGGILFRAQREGQMKHIRLENLTVRNCTYNGVFINGAAGIDIISCDLNENGVSVPPGQKLLHNLLLTHCSQVTVQNCRLATSPLGAGVALEACDSALISGCEIARNGYYGVLITESRGVTVSSNLVEANDRSGVMVEFLYKGSSAITITDNRVQFNAGYGVESYGATNCLSTQNRYSHNGHGKEQQKISAAKTILME